jgi:tRNA pseudouridine38-40 synthase
VQAVVEEALGRGLRLPGPARLVVAGRTDAGVHARGQVAHADVPGGAWEGHGRVLLRRLRGALPPDVRVTSARPAPAGFDARFSALARHYVYRVCDQPAGVDPLRRRDVLDHRRALDVDRLVAASAALVGEHDFAAFCRHRAGATTVRRILELSWARGPEGLVAGSVVADAFCHAMVRSLVGALLPVGDGRRPVDWPAGVLAARERIPAVAVVPARGLTLEAVTYPDPAELAVRAARTRQLRVHRSTAG